MRRCAGLERSELAWRARGRLLQPAVLIRDLLGRIETVAFGGIGSDQR
jgi:hypothetical protein